MKNNTVKVNSKRVFGAKAAVTAAALALVMIVGVGTTAALLIWKSHKDVSVFEAAYTQCSVVVNDGAYSVLNQGDTEAYVRAVVTVTFKNCDGEIYGKRQPMYGVDYELVLNGEDWFIGGDGFYYCKSPIAAGKQSPVFIENFTVSKDITNDQPAANGLDEPVFPDDYAVALDIAVSAIQSTPSEAVENYWYIKPSSDGYLGK